MSATAAEFATRAWAVAGVAILFAEAAWRLGSRGVMLMRSGLTPPEWAALLVVAAAFVYGEGIRAMQRRWVPWVLTRVRLLPHERARYNALAPLYATSLVGTDSREVKRAWTGVAAIVAAILLVSRLPEPWRGIIDFAVAAALSWGLAALLVQAVRSADGGS